MQKPQVSVVFVNYNGKKILRAALSSLRKSTFRDIETLVVDNASTDGSREMIRKEFKDVGVVRNKTNLGYTGINTALPKCSGKYILFLNNDLEIHPKMIHHLFKVLEHDPSAALAVPKLVNYYDRKVDSAGTWVSRSFYNGHHRAEKVDNKIRELPYMGIGLIRKSVAKTFGYLFDPDYFIYAEDLDLGLRIRLLGMSTIYVPHAVSYHMHSQTMKNIPDARKTFLLERNLLTTFFKDLSLPSIICLLPYVYGMRLVVIARDLAIGHIGVALSRIRAIFSVFFHFPSIIRKRAGVQALRRVPDSFLFKVFTEKHLFSKNRITI